ncbi:DUF6705 family protein [Flavobacterium sp. HNIBRBA15423]|uniref:DUF6705 family protein n=1 Tax=Flavobacterium sp. HNIBRBA15423 TaxID=3458683 RepID=UPI004044BD25
MKTIIKLITTILIANYSYSQCNNIVDIDDATHVGKTGYYYKDTHNIFNQFEGHYKYTNGSTSLEIVLQKMELSSKFNNRYCEDMLIGAYKYIKDGVVVIDALNDLNNNYVDGGKYIIDGNRILTGQYLGCNDCASNEKRVVLSIMEPDTKQFYDLFIRKITHNGQEAIKIFLYLDSMTRMRTVGDPPLPPLQLPVSQELILIKQ